MSRLLDQANQILAEKETKIVPENIKQGVTIFDVNGTLQEGIDTSDATAAANDIISPKTAYVNGQKIEGAIIPEYDISGINTDNIIINNTNLGIFDIRYDINYALVGNKGDNSFYICTIKNNTISLEDSIQLSVTDINSTQSFVVSDVKFNIGAPTNGIISIYGCSTYGQAHKYDGANFTDLFKISLNIQDNTYEIQDNVITTSPTKGNFDLSGLIFSHIYMIDKDTFLLKPEIYNIVYGTSATVLPRMIFNNLTLISSLDYGVDGWNTVTTNAYVSRNLFIEYNNDKYRIYNIDNDFNFVKLDDNTDNSTNRVSLVNNSYYLKGCKLYNTNSLEVKDYTNIISNNNYKQYVDGYIYEFNVNNHSVSVYEFNEETLNLTPLKVLENRINNYEMGSSNILTLPSYSYNNYICYGINSENNIYCDILETSNIIKSLTRQNKTYFNIENTTAIESDMLIGKVGYNKTGKVIGTMSNNGELNYTSSTEEQTIPAGYTSGGTIAAVDSSIDENIIPENIKKDISILGVTGTLESDSISDYISQPTGTKLSLVQLIIRVPEIDASDITNMGYSFQNSRLKSVSLLNTNKVTTMDYAFKGCTDLETVSLSDTPNVTSMSSTFLECSNIKTISGLNTKNVTNMYATFKLCKKLEAIPSLDTGKVTNMTLTFNGCSNLKELPLLNTVNVTDMSSAFALCSSLTEIPSFNTLNVTSMSYGFASCTSLVTFPLLSSSSLTNMSNMLQNCPNLSDESLNNVLTMCINATKITSNKTLKYIGLTEEQATKCTILSNYQAFLDAGWTTGY